MTFCWMTLRLRGNVSASNSEAPPDRPRSNRSSRSRRSSVPYPIQSGSLTDRLRKFFRIRGRTGFQLDEMVAPVVIVQDLTKGPYQAGVSPAAGVERVLTAGGTPWAFAVILNDKAGSITPVLGNQFEGRSFSFTWVEIQNINFPAGELDNIELRLATRAAVLAAGVPTGAKSLVGIQNNDGSLKLPVEIFTFDSVSIPGADLWRGLLGDNTNTLGSRRAFEDVQPNITIGPDDALVFTTATSTFGNEIQLAVRGFYQEQPS